MGKYLLLAVALCACVQDGEEEQPFPGSPEAMIESNKAKWNRVASRSYSVDYLVTDSTGTSTIACQADRGIIDTCIKVLSRGGDPDTSILEDYPTPGEFLDVLKQDLARLNYNAARSNETSFHAKRTSVPKDESLMASFDPAYGYPKQILHIGPILSESRAITRFEPK